MTKTAAPQLSGPTILYYVATGFKFPSMKNYVHVQVGEQTKVLDAECVMFRPINAPHTFGGFKVFPGKDAFTDKESAKSAAAALRAKLKKGRAA